MIFCVFIFRRISLAKSFSSMALKFKSPAANSFSHLTFLGSFGEIRRAFINSIMQCVLCSGVLPSDKQKSEIFSQMSFARNDFVVKCLLTFVLDSDFIIESEAKKKCK